MSGIASIDKSKRAWVYAKKPAGKLFNYRQIVGYILLAVLLVMPFIKIQGEPFLMFNVIDRKFVVFGQVFWPQDMYIFLFAMLIVMVMVFLFTAAFGRIWCGWTCPQTIFMELVFRRIEYWLEGDWQKQKRNNIQPRTGEVQMRKLLKHVIFLSVSFVISNIFLAYIIGIDALWAIMIEPIEQHVGGFASILVFTLIFYFVFSYVREIVCTTICPYGRLQGVLMDEKSLNIAYDYRRGEPRGKVRKDLLTEKPGDCVDCNLCVHVCPTGIDIRQGTQMECVNCTACIDACDGVMVKLGRPEKLIGFFSAEQLAGKSKTRSSRTVFYAAVLTILTGVFFWLLLSRTEIDGTLLRATGTTYQLNKADGTVSNLYSLELINKSNRDLDFDLVIDHPDYTIRWVNHLETLNAGSNHKISFFLIAPQSKLKQYKNNVTIGIVSDGKLVESKKTTFIGPPASGVRKIGSN